MAKKNIKVKVENHTFELKNIQVAEFLSEETTAFAADVYIDGKKVGYCSNNGHGEGNYPRIDNQYQDLYQEVEEGVKKNHFHDVTNYGHVCDWDYSMDFLIGMMVWDAHYDNKSTYKF
jgi:hypothetical protein